jgi:decaprenylphospho-beta-D-erythro-pentofuranosid-2-ulose 2-reductase
MPPRHLTWNLVHEKHKVTSCHWGSSDIGRACALQFAKSGWKILIAGRDLPALQREAGDIAARSSAEISTHQVDILDPGSFEDFADHLSILPDAVLSVVGLLGDQARAESDTLHASEIIRANFEGPALLLGVFADRFAKRGMGAIIGVSSVAGERGRAANYVYDASEAGLTAFLSGLRNRFGKTAIRVVTVRPGFVRTRMTKGMKLPALLTAEPEQVAATIYRSLEGRGRDVLYVKPIWLIVMAIIKPIPEPVFKRLRI